MTPPPLTVNQAAEALGVSPSFVRNAIRNGMIGHERFRSRPGSSGAIRIPVSEIERYRKDSLRIGTSQSDELELKYLNLLTTTKPKKQRQAG
jgi:excisionase family DNA binding protein